MVSPVYSHIVSLPGSRGALRAILRLIVLLVMVCAGGSVLVPAADNPPSRVLYLNSYHRGYPWSDGIEQGLRERLDASGKQIELSVEYLDSRRFSFASQIGPLAESMTIKYAKYRPNLIVVSDNAAFEFAIKYRQRLFHGLPMVFCGFNDFRPGMLKGLRNITGVNEEVNILATVDMALKVHPDTRTLVFITSTGDASSKRNHDAVERTAIPKLRTQYKLVNLKDASIEEVGQRLAKLPPETLVFIAGQTRDRGAGRALTPEENGRLISAASPYPTYSFWDIYLKTGVVGGHVLTGVDQGRAAADLVLRILDGTPADAIPVVMDTPSTNMFDYQVMRRFDISPSRLPSDSVIINRSFSVWHAYRWQILGVVGLLGVETVLVLVLIHMIRARRHALAALALERVLLESNVETRTAELKAANDRLALLSYSDGLTQLANRRCFDKVLATEILRLHRTGAPLSLIMLDIDFFKNFNDTYGHVAGDECLRQLGALLEHLVNRPADLSARYGGEEFAVILPETDAQGAMTLARRIHEGIAALAIVHAASLVADHVTASLGVVTINTARPMPLAEIIGLADQQLYKAKSNGRNQVAALDLSDPAHGTHHA